MGFFTSSHKFQAASKPQDELTYDDDYIKLSLRLPSAGNDHYENEGFKAHFESSNQHSQCSTTKKTKSHRFSRFFRREPKKINEKELKDPINNASAVESIPNLKSVNNFLKDPSIRITEKHLDTDENSSIQDSNVGVKRHISLRHGWRSKRNIFVTDINKVELLSTKRSGFKSLFGKSKVSSSLVDKGTVQSPIESSSVYDVQETLTQRYMKNSSGYDRLLRDMDEIPFDLILNDENTLHQKVSKVIQSLSPSKKRSNHLKGELRKPGDKDNEDISKDLDSWNPYVKLKKRDQVDRISITSSEIELSKKYSVKLSVEPKASKIGSLARSISLKTLKRLKSYSNSDFTLPQEEAKVPEDTKDDGNGSTANQKETLSSLFGPDASNPQNEYGYKRSSDSTAVGTDNDIFEKLYSKALDAADENFKNFPSTENLSGSTEFNSPVHGQSELPEANRDVTPPESTGSVSRADTQAYQSRMLVNFAALEIDTYESGEVSSFLQDYYEPTRPATREVSRKPSSQLKRSTSRRFTSVRKNPLEIKPPRPLTAAELFQKQVEQNKQEMAELNSLIKKDRSHHRKVINGLLE